MSLTQSEFDSYRRQGFNRIPVVREVLADLDTPLSVYLKLANRPYSYLFESVQGGEKWGRYSIIGLPCRTILTIADREACVVKDGEVVEQSRVADPLEFIREFKARYRMPQSPGLPRFTGGLVGYFGYESVRYMEPRLGDMAKPDAIGVPDIVLMVSDEVVVFDNLSGKLFIVLHVNPEIDDAYNKAQDRVEEIVSRLGTGVPDPALGAVIEKVTESDFVSEFPREEFEAGVERIREYIRAGDVMQVVLAQRLSVPYRASPLNLYRALRTLNPSPYMYVLNLDGFHIVGSSPEIPWYICP